jgi:hypothetical protein
VLWCLLAAAARVTDAGAPSACEADTELDYVCGFHRPEDLLTIPGTSWLIASGFNVGAGLRFVNATDRRILPAYRRLPTELEPDRRTYPLCATPVDPKLFNARGLSMRANGPRGRLLVVNHGGRESVEVFDLSLDDSGAPRLRWRGCIALPAGQVGNAVASFADGTVLVTVLTRPGTTIADFVAGRNTGAVWRWRPGMESFEPVPGTELPGDNGLEVDPDERHFYVVAFGWHALAVFDREHTGGPIRVITAPDFMPDNVHWTQGRLLLAGMRYDEPACGGTRKVIDGVADPMLCHRGWVVGEVDLSNNRIATLAYGRPQPGFNGVSVAALVSDELWLGSFQSDRLAIVKGALPP